MNHFSVPEDGTEFNPEWKGNRGKNTRFWSAARCLHHRTNYGHLRHFGVNLLAADKPPAVGEIAQDLSLKTVDAQRAQLLQLRNAGPVVLIVCSHARSMGQGQFEEAVR